ncbi:MAG TPA: hypothetical protein PLU33_13010 [Treponemataceae bacterium]|nr:hypothetical protein [Treponemataceae bacterium]
MFKKHMYAAALLLCLFLFLVSCVSPAPKVKGDNFLGDFNPIQLDNLMALHNAINGIKPVEIRTYLVPRTNTVELYFRIFANEIALVLDKKTRDMIRSSIQDYLNLYEKNSLTVQKPSKKNAFVKGSMSIGWGVLSPVRYTTAPFWTNYEYLEEKPYFLLYLNPTPDSNDASAYSPVVKLYLSPAQVREFLDVTDQSRLESIVDEYNTRAYTFE